MIKDLNDLGDIIKDSKSRQRGSYYQKYFKWMQSLLIFLGESAVCGSHRGVLKTENAAVLYVQG